MANFTQNLSDNLRMFGIEPSTKWGSPMVWGTDKWGDGGNTHFNLPTRSMTFNQELSPILQDVFSFRMLHSHSDSVTFMQNGIAEYLRDNSQKYFYALSGGATNDESAFQPTYTLQTNAASVWTLAVNSSATWT